MSEAAEALAHMGYAITRGWAALYLNRPRVFIAPFSFVSGKSSSLQEFDTGPEGPELGGSQADRESAKQLTLEGKRERADLFGLLLPLL